MYFVDKMKDAVIAKVAAQAADFYKSALSSAQIQSVKQMLEKVISCDNNFWGLFVSCFVMWFFFLLGEVERGGNYIPYNLCWYVLLQIGMDCYHYSLKLCMIFRQTKTVF